jgi:hypothetical protein
LTDKNGVLNISICGGRGAKNSGQA